MIADAKSSPEFQKLSREEQAERLSQWVATLSYKIYIEITELINGGKLIDARNRLNFLSASQGVAGTRQS